MLKKAPPVTVIPGSPAVPAREPSVFCGTSVPFGSTSTAQLPQPVSGDYSAAIGYWVYVPSNAMYYVSETPVFSQTPPLGNYTCRTGQFLVPDPAFPGGSKMATETRCYWNYP